MRQTLQVLCINLVRGAEPLGHPGAAIAFIGHRIQLLLCVSAEVCPLGEVLAQQPIGVLVAAPLPRKVGIAEVTFMLLPANAVAEALAAAPAATCLATAKYYGGLLLLPITHGPHLIGRTRAHTWLRADGGRGRRVGVCRVWSVGSTSRMCRKNGPQRWSFLRYSHCDSPATV